MAIDAPLVVRFRRSIYVTLGLACAALGYAELFFLPETAVFIGIVGVLLVVAYRAEGRWTLGPTAANAIGAVIGVASFGWVVYQFFRPWGGTLLDVLPWPTSLLPYLGPMLMILVPAKLFRPKHTGDFWGLQGIGLMAVALGFALAGDPTFAVLMFAYLASLVWSLTLFYLVREADRPGVALSRNKPAGTIRHSGRWLVAVSVLAFGLFLLTPRSGDARWELMLQGRMQVGLEERPTIDLNRAGTVKVNRDLVCDVIARNADGTPKTDLDPAQRWRSLHFNYYENGRWEFRSEFRRDILFKHAEGGAPPPNPDFDEPRPLGPTDFTLEFHPQRGAPTNLYAEPVQFRRGNQAPILNAPIATRGKEGRFKPWFAGPDGDFTQPAALGLSGNRPPHLQVVTPPVEPGVRPAPRDDDMFRRGLCQCQTVEAVRRYTTLLVRRLVDDKRLPDAVWNPAGEDESPDRRGSNDVPPAHMEQVARALEAHLSSSGLFRYTLELVRGDERADPAVDFLTNTHAGHCNRFATALTLMLRSQGIPARIVLGFQGYETDTDGVYEVRQCHAHSWVEAMIQRTDKGEPVWRWLTLDPTPTGEDVTVADYTLSQWVEFTRVNFGSWFRNFIVEYDADQQGRAAVVVGGLTVNVLRGLAYLGGVAVAVVAGLFVRRWWRRSRPAVVRPAVPFYARLQTVLSGRLGLSVGRGQTPREFASVVGHHLRAVGVADGLADLPGEATVAYYRVRFGGERLGDAGPWDERVTNLDATLSTRRPT